MSTKPINVLFLCTHNSARSILAEALLNHIGKGRFQAYSAGSSPRENQQPNPIGLEVLKAAGISTEGLHSKCWDDFGKPDSPVMNLVITVCDNAAGEACPYWPGTPVVAHWGIPDPADGHGSPEKNRAAFELAYTRLHARVTALLALPVGTLSQVEMKTRLAEIGQLDGATAMAASAAKA